MYHLGIIIPVYSSTISVRLLLDNIKIDLKDLPYRVYIVDDSADIQVTSYLKRNCLDENITLIKLKKNYGQQNALLCGVRQAVNECEYIATIDDDLQNPPAIILSLLKCIDKGFDMAYAIPTKPAKNLIRNLGGRTRDLFFKLVFQLKGNTKVSSFRVMTNALAQKISLWQGSYFYMSAVALSQRPAVANIMYDKNIRNMGKSGYNIKKLLTIYIKLVTNYSFLKVFINGKTDNCPYEIEEVLKG